MIVDIHYSPSSSMANLLGALKQNPASVPAEHVAQTVRREVDAVAFQLAARDVLELDQKADRLDELLQEIAQANDKTEMLRTLFMFSGGAFVVLATLCTYLPVSHTDLDQVVARTALLATFATGLLALTGAGAMGVHTIRSASPSAERKAEADLISGNISRAIEPYKPAAQRLVIIHLLEAGMPMQKWPETVLPKPVGV